jgi:hypothetical protein
MPSEDREPSSNGLVPEEFKFTKEIKLFGKLPAKLYTFPSTNGEVAEIVTIDNEPELRLSDVVHYLAGSDLDKCALKKIRLVYQVRCSIR